MVEFVDGTTERVQNCTLLETTRDDILVQGSAVGNRIKHAWDRCK